MFKLQAAITKELLLLLRDRIGLLFMFVMPIILVIVMTAVQNSTFELVNTNKIPMLICSESIQPEDFTGIIEKAGMFSVIRMNDSASDHIQQLMQKNDAMVGLFIPKDYFIKLRIKAKEKAQKALINFGLRSERSGDKAVVMDSIQISFQPILDESYRYSIRGALYSALQIMENKLMIKAIYFEVNNKPMEADVEKEMTQSGVGFSERQMLFDERSMMPNASQHNVPAWTLFAMFFTVISLGGNMVREKRSGSFVRLKLLPTSYMYGLFAKQLVYLFVALMQVLVIFSIGVCIFPLLHLPALNIPVNLGGLFLVSIVCGWSAVSYAVCIGVFAETHEQANGFGAASVVIMAAFGGVFVPAFVMPHSFLLFIKASPFYWGLESFYGLFLENKIFSETLINILPLIAFALVFQFLALTGLKRKNLI